MEHGVTEQIYDIDIVRWMIEVGAGELAPLGTIQYTKSRKQVHCFAGEAGDASPRCASWEVDRAEFMPLSRALELIHPDQRAFLERLQTLLDSGRWEPVL